MYIFTTISIRMERPLACCFLEGGEGKGGVGPKAKNNNSSRLLCTCRGTNIYIRGRAYTMSTASSPPTGPSIPSAEPPAKRHTTADHFQRRHLGVP